mmetsp:Transcript_16534/g.23564  ORF Transcript_16534/g.23564 Transcript_16534/m.23564 type:complete len:1161 (+) Transcript_16534:4649-8131(+)
MSVFIESGYGRRRDHNTTRRSQWKWPRQGLPDRQAWLLWDRALSFLEQNGRLRVTLGAWIHASHQQWEWKLHIATNTVIQDCDGRRIAYKPLTGRGTRRGAMLYSLETRAVDWKDSIQDEWAAVTPIFSEVGDSLFSIRTSGTMVVQQTQNEDTETIFPSFQDRVLSSAEFFLRLIGPLPVLTDATLKAIGIYIKEGSLLTCSDGSSDPALGTACQAWVMADKDGHVLWGGVGPIDGNPEWVTSYRSELGGITAILYILQQMVLHLDITSGSVMLYCDNKGALENVFDEQPKRGIYPLLERDYDMLGAARAIRRDIPIKVTGTWVKGHYKGNNREIQHDLNDLADYIATQFQQNPPEGFRSRRMPALHPHYEAELYHSNSVVTTNFRDILYHQIFAKDLAATIQKRTGWPVARFNGVAWKAYAAAFKSQSKFRQIAISKLSHDLWHTGAQKKLYGKDDEGLCPVCKLTLETVDHVFQCADAGSDVLKRTLLEVFRDSLYLLGTPQVLIGSMLAGLEWWLLGYDEDNCPRAPGYGRIYSSDVLATNAYAHQTTLGWGQLLRGRLSRLWGHVFASETKSTSRKEDAMFWTKKTVKLLWDLAFKIWGNRNGILHGKTVMEQQAIRQAILTARIEEVFQIYATNSSCVSAASRHLFEEPMERLQLRNRQYQLCWLRSVDVAIAKQIQDTEILRRQARKFFGKTSDEKATLQEVESAIVPMSPHITRELSLAIDISSPDHYNLRRRWRDINTYSDNEDTGIPPAMFQEQSESSYSGSFQTDVQLRSDFPISPGEQSWLVADIHPLSISQEETTDDESYIQSYSSDVTLISGYISPREATDIQDIPYNSSNSQGTQASSLTDELHDRTKTCGENSQRANLWPLFNLPEHNKRQEDWETPVSNHSTGTAWRLPSFPLYAIGAIQPPRLAEEEVSPLSAGWSLSNDRAQATSLMVYGETRGENASSEIFQLWQNSLSGESSERTHITMCSGLDLSLHPIDNRVIHRLVNRAIHWLLRQHIDNRFPPVSSSVYWAIRSLPVFYDAILKDAHRKGAPTMIELHEEEWPDPPDGADIPDNNQLPDWLIFILTLDNIYEWGLKDITWRRDDGREHRKSAWFLPESLFLQDIPWREQDDPPDSVTDTDTSGDHNIIEEISSNESIEDNNLRRT